MSSSSESDIVKPVPSKIQICGDGDECIIIAGHKYYRHELFSAFAGTLQSEHLAPPPVHQFGNPTAFALGSYSVATLTVGLYLVNAKDVQTPNLIYGATLFCSGLGLFLGGIWEFFVGNTFGCTSLISYGAYWLSYSAVYIPAFGIMDAYKDAPGQFENAMGLWLVSWAIYTTMLWICTFKATYDLIAFFGFLDLSIIVLGAYHFTGLHSIQVAGGVFCILTALSAFYMMLTGIATQTNTYIRFPNLQVPIWGN